MHVRRVGLALLGAAALAACAGQPKPQARDPVASAVEQPMRDLSLVRDDVPPVLGRAAAAPYQLTEPADCAQLRAALAELDEALGPDVDAPAPASDGMAGLAGDLVGGAVGLPFRGVIRRMTGAAQRDADFRRAVLAGMVRRGYLKGRLAALTCPPTA